MSKEKQEGVSHTRRGRRTLLKGAIIVLGASAILQPAGAVFGQNNGQETPKKDGGSVQQAAKPGSSKPDIKWTPGKTKSKKKGGKKKEETPKKEGS